MNLERKNTTERHLITVMPDNCTVYVCIREKEVKCPKPGNFPSIRPSASHSE